MLSFFANFGPKISFFPVAISARIDERHAMISLQSRFEWVAVRYWVFVEASKTRGYETSELIKPTLWIFLVLACLVRVS